ncbi:MAG: helix-turn-helix transcriptional regulator [Coprobacillus sp.]
MRRLRDLREDRDMTQSDIAKMLGVTQTTYSRYESGVLNPPIDVLKELALYYETSIDYLVDFTDERNGYKRKK